MSSTSSSVASVLENREENPVVTTMSEISDDKLGADLAALRQQGLLRSLRPLEGPQDRSVVVDGQRLVNFSSNNYLGLANHPEMIAAASAAAKSLGVGAGASRLIVGSLVSHSALEVALADFHDREAALLFNSGYHANVGIIPALVGSGDTVFSDQLSHASIIDGCRLSRASVVVYPHRDVLALEKELARPRGGRKLIVTDSVFSMDGDKAPLVELRGLATRHGAFLMVDEAHAVGLIGPAGRGLAAAQGVVADVHVATFGKAMGSFGAYVAGSRELIEVLVNRARSFIFTTALPPAVVAVNHAALALIGGDFGVQARRRLTQRISEFISGINKIGISASSDTAIVPVLVGDAGKAMKVSQALRERGVLVQGIRPPTVPRGTSRLRFTLMASHGEADIEMALNGLRAVVEHGLLDGEE